MEAMHSNLKDTAKQAFPKHPFYPLGVEVVGYLANDWSVPMLLAAFAAGWVVILWTTHLMVKQHNPGLPNGERLALLWFVLTGTIHLFFEGYFSLNHMRMGGRMDFFGQLWKEYALSDSRYLTSDPFVLCMETITAFLWGPLSFITAWFITIEHPLRHPLQSLVSIGQLYGVILYYATSMFDHYYNSLTYCRPEGYYFWVYYFFMNFIWVMIPGYLVYQSFEATAEAFKASNRFTKNQQANGHTKKSA